MATINEQIAVLQAQKVLSEKQHLLNIARIDEQIARLQNPQPTQTTP